MKPPLISYSSALAVALFALPISAWADRNPDFDDDAKPLLRMQPGLLEFVESRFQVKDTGVAKVPGDDERHAMPPYIFQAKPRGYPGSYYLTLLIQPGHPGHILKIVDPTKPNGGAAPRNEEAPESPEPTSNYQPAPPPSQPSTVSHSTTTVKTTVQSTKTPTAPTAETPSGPVAAPFPPPPSSTAPSLEPPPDPAPATH